MKKLLLFISIFIFEQLCPQNIDNMKSKYQVSETVTYETALAGWSWNGSWLYNNNEATDLPNEYTEIKKIVEIDSTALHKVIITYQNIVTTVNIFCSTMEKYWKWNSDHWIFKGTVIKFFPASYEKHTTVSSTKEEWDSGNVNKNINKEYKETIEYYAAQNGWVWNESKKMWLYDNKKVNMKPVYRLEKTVTRMW